MLGSVHLEVEKCHQAVNVSSVLILSAGSEGPGCVWLEGVRASGPPFLFSLTRMLRSLAWFVIQASSR